MGHNYSYTPFNWDRQQLKSPKRKMPFTSINLVNGIIFVQFVAILVLSLEYKRIG